MIWYLSDLPPDPLTLTSGHARYGPSAVKPQQSTLLIIPSVIEISREITALFDKYSQIFNDST